MRSRKPLMLTLTMLVATILLPAQGRPPLRGTLDDRLAAIEDRIAALETRLDSLDEKGDRQKQADRLTLASEAKLDRLEVRVIQLENRTVAPATGGIGQRDILSRLRSLERQVARLRAMMNR